MIDLTVLSLSAKLEASPAASDAVGIADAILAGSYPRLTFRARNGAAFIICRQFSATRKQKQLATLKAATWPGST